MDNHKLYVKDSQYKDLPVLVLMTFALFAIKAIWAVLISTGPTYPDELLYKLNASTIYALQKYATAHFPPAYSLVLSPAIFFKQWYEAMLVLNAFWSSIVVPAAWFLARSVGIKKPLLAALLAALLPMHAIYTHLLLSENLFVPLFVLAVALALRGGKRGHIEALAFGLVLGIAHLTKYLFLPALPLLFGAWLYTRSKRQQEVPSGSLIKRCYPGILVLFAYGLVTGIWLCYGCISGFNWSQLFGFGITKIFAYSLSGIKTKAATVDSFLMWATAYTSYIVIAWLPLWGIITIWVSQLSDKAWRIQLEPRHQRFLMLGLLLLGCYWIVAVQHSFGSWYNYPIPVRLIGRYLMHLSPIVLIAGVLIMERLAESQAQFRKMKALIGVGVVVELSFLAWGILFNRGIWKFSVSFPMSDSGGVDVIAFASPPMYLMAIAIVLLPLVFLCVRKADVRLLVLPIVTLMLVSLVVDARRMNTRQDGLHARELSYAAASLTNQEGDTVNILLDGKEMSLINIQKRLLFWGVKQKQLLIQDVSIQRVSGFASIKSPTLLLSSTLFNLKPLREYIVNDKTYYIYRIDGIDPKVLQPIILTSGKDGK